VRAHGIRGLGIIVRCGALPEPFNDFATIPSGDATAGALKRLTALTEDKDARIRCEALHALASARDDAPDLNLGLLLDDDSPRVRYFAAQVVAKRKMTGFFDPICEMLEQNANKDPWLRQAGAYALQQMATDSSLLRALVNHGSSAVRLAAVIGLRRMECPDVAVFIDDEDPLVAEEAVRTVCDLDLVEARPAVAAWFESKAAASIIPAPVNAAPPASTGFEDIHTPQVERNPWLYIVIGLLVLTGILLYVDPRIF
jgi:quinoprotein glucose dehydrogenase